MIFIAPQSRKPGDPPPPPFRTVVGYLVLFVGAIVLVIAAARLLSPMTGTG